MQTLATMLRLVGQQCCERLHGPIRKQITKRFKENGLKITIQCNLKSADYLDATLNLTNVPFQPYRKLNDEPPYTKSNHPPTVIKQVSKAINRRLSSNKETFDLSTTKPSDQVDSTKAFTTARKTQPHQRKEIE